MLPRLEAIRWVFFDFAGTLAFNDPARAWHYLRACARRGCFLDRRQVWAALTAAWSAIDCPEGLAHPGASADRDAYERFRRAIEHDVLERLGFTGDREAVVQEVLDAQDDPNGYSLYPEVAGSVRTLKEAGYRLCIVSNFHWALPALVDAFGLAPHFEAVVTSAQAGYRKPHPRIFEAAAESTGTRPGEVLFIGDSLEADVRGAASYGFRSLLLDRRASGKYEVPSIAALDELPSLLGRSKPGS